MPRYFLHLRDHVEEIRDPDGIEFADLETLKSAVVREARDVMCGDLRNGIIDLRYRIDAENAAGVMVYSLPFSAAVSVIPQGARD
ncbi:MAG: hypothetical protein V4659_11365 [Pseudomonadota bacterium]